MTDNSELGQNVVGNVVNTDDIAFAIGGLAGHNYHGLGFLQGAYEKYKEKHFMPKLISCTTGQIYWVWHYLLAIQNRLKNEKGAEDLEQIARNELEYPTKPGYTFPDPQFLMNWSANHIRQFADMFQEFADMWAHRKDFEHNAFGHFLGFYLYDLPAKVLSPVLSKELCEKISHDFNQENRIALIFNSYDPVDGVEHIYANGKAQQLLQRTPGTPSSFRQSKYHTTIYREITPEAVEDALWIYEYGFEGRQHVDGAYFRQIMLSELTTAKTIYVVRPVNYRWLGDLPTSLGGKEDLKTEVFFNAAYYGEKFRIELINRLLASGAISPTHPSTQGYHHIDIKEIEVQRQKGFLGYFAEDMESFNRAREAALDLLDC